MPVDFLALLRAIRASLGELGLGREGFARATAVACFTLDICNHCLMGRGTILNTKTGGLEDCPICQGQGTYHQGTGHEVHNH
jgi:hypothetical protein